MTKFINGFRSSSSIPEALRRLARCHSPQVLVQSLYFLMTFVVAMAYHPSNLSYSQQRMQQQIVKAIIN